MYIAPKYKFMEVNHKIDFFKTNNIYRTIEKTSSQPQHN